MAIINFNSISGVSTVTATHSVTVGDTFIKDSKVGLGTITTADRNAGVGTAIGTIVYNETTGEVQIYKRNSGWVNISNVGDESDIDIGAPLGLTATGGVISDYTDPGPGNVYRAHIFTSSGTFEVSAIGDYPADVEYLVVAGGGGGGVSQAGGGGAGGLRTNLSGHPLSTNNPSFAVTVASYPVTIGAGGAGGTTAAGADGVNSVLGHPSTPITSLAGGGGGSYPSVAGRAGGSGGGGGRSPTSTSGGSGSYPGSSQNPQPYRQGYDGGTANTPYATPYSGAGGGGAGGAGTDSGGSTVGTGGAGVQVLIAGPPTHTGVGATGPSSPYGQWFAGGGGGGANSGFTNAPAGGGGAPNGFSFAGGGIGGGGTGGTLTGGAGTSGTGGGGGGGSHPTSDYPGGNGGSGIVVVRYQIGRITAEAKATGGSVSFYDGKTIHTFTSSGTFTAPASFSETVEYVAIGGGGGGGVQHGGGGGAGGYTTTSTPLSGPFSAPIVIGAGGNGLPPQSSLLGQPGAPGNGNNTTLGFPSPVTAGYGGGGGSLGPPPNAPEGAGTPAPLGSGGGGALGQPGTPSPAGGTGGPQGNAGGAGRVYSGGGIGGGGGGAGGAGNSGSDPTWGIGGDGVRLPTTFRNPAVAPTDTSNPFTPERGGGLGTPGPGGSFYVAGGGGGGSHNPWTLQNSGTWGAPGGFGGGGHGGNNNPDSQYYLGSSAVQSTGAGGGATGPHSNGPGGNGGSGIVLIAYPS